MTVVTAPQVGEGPSHLLNPLTSLNSLIEIAVHSVVGLAGVVDRPASIALATCGSGQRPRVLHPWYRLPSATERRAARPPSTGRSHLPGTTVAEK